MWGSGEHLLISALLERNGISKVRVKYETTSGMPNSALVKGREGKSGPEVLIPPSEIARTTSLFQAAYGRSLQIDSRLSAWIFCIRVAFMINGAVNIKILFNSL